MHKGLFGILLLASNLCSAKVWVNQCQKVYTIGAYDEAFKQQVVVMKLGPLPANKVPPAIPQSFLEADGSYGGGEGTCTITQACQLLKEQLDSGILPSDENWHIYQLEADWEKDIYQLHPNDYRLKHPVRVLKLVKSKCF
ncbi:DVU_2496 family lipoprotein [Legionella jamestowniensis]|uniref:Uncharacterized protein n=1 Tax=Legionella jamestowniensis TaxID=455 RepID=A0A0W0UHS2_9GAMM|nr:DVU_2496 family lipoprotein [Legionella jamestowniensis]KTD07255.1 hypothetical protein Ljam_1450 [Legionella jamestowniensis]OCH97996.1 hypothetical protein A8135_01880 [Legionella jamestowniensis]SFL95589.1 hypothetical protein SAMN02746073_2766 [Legionella jamestowniensis DSM 19215]